ncbi:MAG TPA: class I SAM-dependent methyltransferase [Prolixibacteraceae bacterium]|nr:class I SAM-dependent methyltransferase [Prolixibacteraceae bacterium]
MDLSIELEQYIRSHIAAEEPFLNQLERETNLTCIHPRMLSGHIQGKVLYMLCKMIQPHRVLELGTYTGYSAISMALALDNDAMLHTIEVRDEQEEIIAKYIAKARLGNKISTHFGDAKDIVPSIDEMFDLVFIDADKREYTQYYQLVFDKVKQGGYIIADNILWDGKVVDPSEANDAQTRGIIEFNAMVQADVRVENVIFPFRDGMMVVRKK